MLCFTKCNFIFNNHLTTSYHPTIRLGALYAASPHGSRMVTLVSRIVTTCYHPYHPYDSTIRPYDWGPLSAASPHGSRMVSLDSRIVTTCYHPYHPYDSTIRPYDWGPLSAASPHGSRMVTLDSRIVTISYHPYHRYDSTIRLGAPLCCLTTWFTDRHHILPSVPSVRFDHTIGGPSLLPHHMVHGW